MLTTAFSLKARTSYLPLQGLSSPSIPLHRNWSVTTSLTFVKLGKRFLFSETALIQLVLSDPVLRLTFSLFPFKATKCAGIFCCFRSSVSAAGERREMAQVGLLSVFLTQSPGIWLED